MFSMAGSVSNTCLVSSHCLGCVHDVRLHARPFCTRKSKQDCCISKVASGMQQPCADILRGMLVVTAGTAHLLAIAIAPRMLRMACSSLVHRYYEACWW